MIIKDVSAAELEVMEIIWAAGKPVIITDIWQAIEGHDWTYQTVQTFVNRLNMKGFIKIVGKKVRSFEYLPLLTPCRICCTDPRSSAQRQRGRKSLRFRRCNAEARSLQCCRS